MIDKQYILVLDYGSQYNQLIVRRIREMGVYSVLQHHDIDIEELKKDKLLKGIVLSGGPNSVYEEGAFTINPGIFDLNVPILGVCYGMQLISQELGGKVVPGTVKEFGKTEISVDDVKGSTLFKDTADKQVTWMSHMDKVISIPESFTKVAHSDNTEFVAMENNEKQIYGIQFHPEVTHTQFGGQILKNFVELCDIQDKWSMVDIVDTLVNDIRAKVGKDNVILALSGGVDSSVVAYLLEKAIPGQLTCVFVNHGLLRKNEAEQVEKMFSHMNLKLIVKDERELFFKKLKGATDPEAKRKIIGGTFIDVFDEVASTIDNAKWLAQGTIYADVIESGTKTAETIKSHHNVGGLPEDLQFGLVEPLRELFKDEVRKLGVILGMPEHMVYRQPFPGPGLGIRVMNEVTPDKVAILQDVDAIVREEIEAGPDKFNAWQYFAVLLNGVKSVGVVGDQRQYGEVVAVRAVSSIDGMSADFCDIDHKSLAKISTRIINEVPGVARVVYDITSKPPGTIEWE
ncbi:glutamine-hydrolyzing GMP synthase [Mycoplasma sp. P36-A1]|uniref:glutamine-hydrolyzing GMP synthase n=1 Tax=Mycoplasma sp. P36-A1 TaxID=3252900 RepID=UPI003C2E28B5